MYRGRRLGLSRTTATRAAWLVLLLVAARLRLLAPDWDGGIAAHPDERYVLGVAASVPLGANVCAYAPDFPYGHLPITLAQVLVRAAPGHDPLYAARLLSGLVGVVGVAVAGRLGRQLAGSIGGLLAVTVAAFSPLLIQQAHFYTVDPLGMTLASGAILAAQRRRWELAGMLGGLALACKLTLVIVFVPLLITALVGGAPRGVSSGGAMSPRLPRVGLGAACAFLVASPWSLLTPRLCWRGPLQQSLMAAGHYELPYTMQYSGTLPYVYPIVQMGLWGLGALATLSGALGLLIAIKRLGGLRRAVAVPAWSWALVYLCIVGGVGTKFPRYMLPLYPVWAAWAAYGIIWLWGQRRFAGALLGVLTALTTSIAGLAQIGVYGQPHPWIVASERLYERLEPGSIIGIEAWDHPLPVPLPAGDVSQFVQRTAPLYDDESTQKSSALSDLSAQADVLVIASRRGYGALARWPLRFPETLEWYAGSLHGRSVEVYTRCPRIGPVAFSDDPLRDAGLDVGLTVAQICGTRWAVRLPHLDESFRVYDAPLTLLLWPRR